MLGSDHRLTLYPIRCQRLWALYKKAQSSFWSADHFCNNTDDHVDVFGIQAAPIKGFIKRLITHYSWYNAINLETLKQLYGILKLREAEQFLGQQLAQTGVHIETLLLVGEMYLYEYNGFERVLEETFASESMNTKMNWIKRRVQDSAISIGERLVATAAFDSIFMASTIASINSMKVNGQFTNLANINRLITTDNLRNCQFFIELLKYAQPLPSGIQISNIIDEAVDLEIEFTRKFLTAQDYNLKEEEMISFVRFVGDWLLLELGQDRKYREANPYPFIPDFDAKSRNISRHFGLDYK